MIPTWLQALLDAQEEMIEGVPAGRARSLALTKLDEARLWAREAERVADRGRAPDEQTVVHAVEDPAAAAEHQLESAASAAGATVEERVQHTVEERIAHRCDARCALSVTGSAAPAGRS